MSSLSDIIIRVANQNDYDIILNGFRTYYEPQDPLTIGFIERTSMTPKEEELFMNLLNDDNSVIAMKHNRLAGFILNGRCDPKSSDAIIVYLDNDFKLSNKMIAFDSIMKIINDKVNIYERYNISESFNLCVVAVDPEFRGQSIGKRLFQKSFEIAKSKGYKIAYVDCTGKYSSQIAERVGMEFVTSVKYSDFKNNDGIPIFQPPDEHTHLKRFVKVL